MAEKFPSCSLVNFGSVYFPARPKTFVRPRPRPPVPAPVPCLLFCHCCRVLVRLSPSRFFPRNSLIMGRHKNAPHLLNIYTKRRVRVVMFGSVRLSRDIAHAQGRFICLEICFNVKCQRQFCSSRGWCLRSCRSVWPARLLTSKNLNAAPCPGQRRTWSGREGNGVGKTTLSASVSAKQTKARWL